MELFRPSYEHFTKHIKRLTMNQEPIDELKEQLQFYTTKVQKNTTIVTPSDIKQSFLLHVAIKEWKSLIPNVSKIAASSEDNTVPRVHTAPTLLGCIVGSSILHYNMFNKKPLLKNEYLGGYYIHKIPFDVALKPNDKLVYDSSITNECWLVTYNLETKTYPATVIGKYFPVSIESIPRVNKYPKEIATIYLELASDDKIQIDNKKSINRGFYKLVIDVEEEITIVTEITVREFKKEIELKATMLCLTDDVDVALEYMKESFNTIPPEIVDAANEDPVLKGFIAKERNRVAINDSGKTVGFIQPAQVQRNGKLYWRTGNIYILPEFRNKGLGTKTITDFFSDKPYGMAWIAFDNIPSMTAFSKAGFRKVNTETMKNPRNKLLYLWVKEPIVKSILTKW